MIYVKPTNTKIISTNEKKLSKYINFNRFLDKTLQNPSKRTKRKTWRMIEKLKFCFFSWKKSLVVCILSLSWKCTRANCVSVSLSHFTNFRHTYLSYNDLSLFSSCSVCWFLLYFFILILYIFAVVFVCILVWNSSLPLTTWQHLKMRKQNRVK